MKNLFLVFIVLLTLTTCKEQKIPAFITINDFTIVGNPNLSDFVEGELSSNITNVLVYVNGNNQGFYELPARIPIIAEGNTDIILYPAVQQNGISGTIIDYPFYTQFDTTLNLTPEGEYEISPNTMYKTNIATWIMDFEGASSLNSEPNSMVDMSKVGIADTHQIEYGNGCGWVHLEGADSSMWNARTNSNINPSGQLWLELDYKMTNSLLNTFIVGTTSGTEEFPFLFVNRSNKGSEYWKKIYIDLTENNTATASSNYIEAGFTGILDDDLTSSDIYLDNIKLIYFP